MTVNALRLAKNFLYLSGAEVASKIVTFAAIAYLARMAGPAGYGYVEFASAVMLCAGLIVDQGLGPYGAREIAKEPERTVALVWEIVFARFILALVAYAAVIAFAILLNRGTIVTQLLLIYGLSLLGMPLLLQWVFQGHNAMQTVAIIQVIRQTVFAVVIFVFVRTDSQIWVAGVAEIAGVVSAAVYGVWMYRRQFQERIRVRLNLSRQLFREGLPIGLSQLFWMLRMFGATVIVGLVASAEEVGFFGAAMRILVALHAFVFLYYFNLLPSLSQSWKRNDGTFVELLSNSLRGIVWISVIGSIVWVLLAPVLITTVYGAAFEPAGTPLQLLAGVFLIAGLSGHYRFGLIAAGRQTAEMVAQAFGSTLAIALILIGYGRGGIAGAAAGLVVAEMVVWVITWWWSREKLGLKGHMVLFVKPVIATGAALGLLRLLPPSALGAQILVVVLSVSVIGLTFDGNLRASFRRVAAAWLTQ